MTVLLTAGGLVAGATPAVAEVTTGSISGTVAGGGKNIANAWVSLYEADSLWHMQLAGTTTDASGNYTFTDLEPGNYKIEFQEFSGAYAPLWWKNATTFDSATSVAVAAGATTSGINGALVLGATISGNVKLGSASGANLDGVYVYAMSDTGDGGQAVTDASGNYTIRGLVAGPYTLQFEDSNYRGAAQWWSGKTTRDSADTFTVAASATVSGKNAILAPAATISGNVKGAGNPAVNLAGISVSAMSDEGVFASATTDDAGNYALQGLPAGSYNVQFDASGTLYMNQYWDGKSSPQDATSIVVAAGQTRVANAVLAKGASISGNVKGAGSPNVNLAGIQVQILADDPNYWGGYFETDVNGNYVITGLPAGSYTLRFDARNSGKNYVSMGWSTSGSSQDPTPITVVAGETVTGKNAVLPVGATISGNVKGAGSPAVNLAGVYVSTMSNSVGSWGSAVTDSNGNYTVIGLPAGDYSLTFDAASAMLNYVSQAWGATSAGDAPRFAVAASSTVTGKDVVMAKGGTISGNVKAAGSPTRNLEGVTVSASGISDDFYAWQSASTDSYGNYTIYGLAAGAYTVSFDYYGGGYNEQPFARQWWNGATVESAATPATVVVGQDSAGKNATLVEGSELTGTVTDAAGSPLADIIVPVWQKVGTEWTIVQASSTDSEGIYRISRLNSGTYKVGFTDTWEDEYWNASLIGDVYSAQFFSGKATLATADSITVGAATTVTNPTVVLQKKAAAPTPLTATPVPTVGGTAQVGKVLTASAGTWTPEPVTLAYQWNRDGTAITGATAATYTLATADLGKAITVTVTGSKAGFTTVSKTSVATAAVIAAATPELPALTAAPVPTIAGTATVGKALTATAGTWTPAPVTLAYQWNRDGVAISGATAATYSLVAADAGKKVTVSVTGTKTGYASATRTSAATATVTEEIKPFVTTPVPTVSGTPEVGRTLTAAAGAWSPAPDALSFQWLRDGVAISGATAGTHALTTADLGKRLTVTVTGVKAGYTTAAQTSVPSPVIAAAAVFEPVVSQISGDDRYKTAVKIAESFEPDVKVVYVATGGKFPDALAAAPAAAVQGGPLLLTTDSSLPEPVKKEIERLKPQKIVVVGGETAVSASVYTELSKLTPSIRRDAGGDRFETARVIVEKAFGEIGSDKAFVATARDFPDALAASAAAGAVGAPVVLVDGHESGLDAATTKLLTDLTVSEVAIAGGTAVVNTKMEASLKSLVGATKVSRLGGADRYETSGAINRASFTDSDFVYLAVGTGYADALAGAALAGKNKAPLYTVQGHCVPPYVIADIASLGATKVVLLGGVNALGVGVKTLTPCS
ncbi:carboxypeptidase regulatory-like domain-containing protein [Mycetocola sp. 2940]|uniref:carboxypeptidase regulatory-like domain-containing protein n=1 Tax=Mycetocola sp. 2940 TaxID=3156452 RepID=UPI003392DEB2